jgi:hypothetical protein
MVKVLTMYTHTNSHTPKNTYTPTTSKTLLWMAGQHLVKLNTNTGDQADYTLHSMAGLDRSSGGVHLQLMASSGGVHTPLDGRF